MAFYKRRIVRPDTPADVEERIRYRRASERALAELHVRWPMLTVENEAAQHEPQHEQY